MRPEERDPAHLWDMLENSRFVAVLIGEMTLDTYLKDRVKQLALERVLEIIGESRPPGINRISACPPRDSLGQDCCAP